MTAVTSGMISRGICSVGRRMSVRAGPILLASSEALPQRCDGAAEDDDVGGEQDQQDRNGDPPYPPEEVRDDVVDDDVAMRKVLGDADTHDLAVDDARDAGAGNRLGQRRRLCRGARLAAGRKQQTAVGVADIIQIPAIGFGVETAQAVRQIERQQAVRLRDDPFPQHFGLRPHGFAVQLVDFGIEQPEHHQRQEDGNHRDRHDVHEHDAPDQRFERRRSRIDPGDPHAISPRP
ncbi:hypothetical protein ACVWWR_006382 [Bradyrhizobium sp. LM3.2]